MATTIVQINVSVGVAPTPSTLQQTYALVSQGGSTFPESTLASSNFLTQLSDLTSHLTAAAAIATSNGAVWSSSPNIVTITAAAPHGLTVETGVEITIAGVKVGGNTNNAYNGTFLCTIIDATTFSYPLASNPGTSSTTSASYVLEDSQELNAMATTWFAQGNNQGVYVLELGEGNPNDGVATLTTFLQNNPSSVYGLVVPREWDGNTAFGVLRQSYNSPSGMLYFWVTSTPGTYTDYTDLDKSALVMVEAPGVATANTEFDMASAAYVAAHYAPGPTNKVTPFGFSYLFGVTPYPTPGNGPLFQAYKNAGVNYVDTGAEGGISNTILKWGTNMDLNPFNFWYSVDWVSINAKLRVANAVINGSNNPINPLYFNQTGINRLSTVLTSLMSNAVTFGLALNPPVATFLDGPALDAALDAGTYDGFSIVNSVPFVNYINENPGDYKIGRYSGFSIIYTPLRGFEDIIINLVASQFAVN